MVNKLQQWLFTRPAAGAMDSQSIYESDVERLAASVASMLDPANHRHQLHKIKSKTSVVSE